MVLEFKLRSKRLQKCFKIDHMYWVASQNETG